MLLNSGRQQVDLTTEADSIHNYYERLVFDQIVQVNERARSDTNFFSDVACVSLNHLPPRYIRHDVDMTFFLSSVELKEIHANVEVAVKEAIDHVTSRDQANTDSEPDITN